VRKTNLQMFISSYAYTIFICTHKTRGLRIRMHTLFGDSICICRHRYFHMSIQNTRSEWLQRNFALSRTNLRMHVQRIYHRPRRHIGWLRLVGSLKVCLFCKRALWKRLNSAKETYNFKEPTNWIHRICHSHTNATSWKDARTCTLTNTHTHTCLCALPSYPLKMPLTTSRTSYGVATIRGSLK